MTLLSISLFMYSVNALAWDHRSTACHPKFKKVPIHPCYYVSPILGGLAFLYCCSLATKERETKYVVVPSSSTVIVSSAAPERAYAETITINIPNSNGSYAEVLLRKSGEGYIGPQGEYYPKNPTVEQLNALYGK